VAARVGTTTAPGTFLAPYVPSPEVIVDRMLEIARVGPGDTVYDLGSGDGRVVVAAAQRFGARALGIELDDQRFATASARVRDMGLAARARIVHGDLASVDLRPATVVTLYQLPSVNDMLRPALERQLRPGARVVTHDFPINGWSPSQVVTGRLQDGSQHAIYLYTVGETRKESAIMAIDSRSYVSTQASLELDGVVSGLLKSSEGGEATAEVAVEKVGLDNVARKHIAGVTYTDLELRFGAGMSNDLYDWIAATLQRKSTRRNGAVVMADYNGKVQSRQEFFNSLISEIGFPACDAGAKDAAFMTMKIAPEYTRTGAASGQKTSSGAGYNKKSAHFLPSNFRLTINGLDCSRVSKIDALVVRQKISPFEIGEARDYAREPDSLEIPNLAFTIVDDDKNGLREWFDDFVVKGNSTVEKNGTLEFLSANLKDPLFTLTFSNLGIFRLARQKVEAGSEKVRQLCAEMYCEQLALSYSSSASTGTGANAGQSAGTGSGAASSQSGAAYSGAAASPIYVRPFVASVADKLQVVADPQNLVAAPRLGRPLKFRS
jgi:protein-L-isoaspartate O-methyltransferase